MSIHVGGYFVVLLLIGVATLMDFPMLRLGSLPCAFLFALVESGSLPESILMLLGIGSLPYPILIILGSGS